MKTANRNNKQWSREEINFVRATTGLLNTQQQAEALGRTDKAIAYQRFILKNGPRVRKSKTVYTIKTPHIDEPLVDDLAYEENHANNSSTIFYEDLQGNLSLNSSMPAMVEDEEVDTEVLLWAVKQAYNEGYEIVIRGLGRFRRK
jgi:hypothetical protein